MGKTKTVNKKKNIETDVARFECPICHQRFTLTHTETEKGKTSKHSFVRLKQYKIW